MKSAFGDHCGSSTRATVKIETSATPEDLSADATDCAWSPLTHESSMTRT